MDNPGSPIVGVLHEINGALEQVTAGALNVVTSLSEVGAMTKEVMVNLNAASETIRTVEQQVAAGSVIIGSSVQEAERKVIASTERLQRSVQTTTDSATSKLQELLSFLEMQQDPGSVGLLASLQAFEEGLVDKTKLLMSFGESVIFYKGEMVQVRQLLDEVLPATGSVQQRIQQLGKDLEAERISTDEVLQQLKASHFEYSQILAEMVEGFRAGRVSLEEIERAAAQLNRQFQGSEAATVALELAERARQGRL